MDSVFEGQVGILRLSQPQCYLGVPLNKLNVYVCVGYVPVRVHRLLRMRERWPGSPLRLSEPQEGRRGSLGGKQLPPKSAHSSGCDRSGLPLILRLGWEPGREGPSVILSQLRTYAFPLKQINNCRAAVPSSSVSKKKKKKVWLPSSWAAQITPDVLG